MAQSDRWRLAVALGAVSLAVGMLVMLVVGWGYQNSIKANNAVHEAKLASVLESHRKEVAYIKSTQTTAHKRHEQVISSLADISYNIAARCTR